MVLKAGNGVCGTAVAERRNLNIPDVRRVENYLACSVETRSELVVLIRSGDRIHAQVDIDSHEVNAFDEGAVADLVIGHSSCAIFGLMLLQPFILKT